MDPLVVLAYGAEQALPLTGTGTGGCVCVCLSHFLSTRLQVRPLNGFLQLIA